MSEQCALEILENNDMIKVGKEKWIHKIAEKQYPFENDIIKRLEIPFKSIKIKEKGEKFDERFRRLMQKNGYLYTKSSTFIKQKDIDNFLKELPQTETIWTEELNNLIINYIEKKYDFLKIEKKAQYTGHGHHMFSNRSYVTKITNLKTKKERIKNEKNREQEAIKFMEQLF